MAWWKNLSTDQQVWFVVAGLLGVFVIGMVVGTVGVCNLAVLEPLAHLGYGFGIGGLVLAFFMVMAL